MLKKSVQILATLSFLPVLVEVAAVEVGLLACECPLAFRPGFPATSVADPDPFNFRLPEPAPFQ